MDTLVARSEKMFLSSLSRPPPLDAILAAVGISCLFTSFLLLCYVLSRLLPLLCKNFGFFSLRKPRIGNELLVALRARLRLDLVMIPSPYDLIEGDNFTIKLSHKEDPWFTQVSVNGEHVSQLFSDQDLATLTREARNLVALKEKRDRLLTTKMFAQEVRNGERPTRTLVRHNYHLICPPDSRN